MEMVNLQKVTQISYRYNTAQEAPTTH